MSSNKAGGIKYKKDYKNLLKPEEVMKNSINYLHPLRIQKASEELETTFQDEEGVGEKNTTDEWSKATDKLIPNILERKNIKFLTQNFFMLANTDFLKLYKTERLAYFVKHHLNNYDIVCVQECMGMLPKRDHEFLHYARLNGFNYSAVNDAPTMTSEYLGDGGILIVSRFPIVEQEFRNFKYGVYSDSIAQKGVQFAKIKIQDEYLLVFNTHLNASYISESMDEVMASVNTRLIQLETIRDFVNLKIDLHAHQHPDKKPLVILAGDLNVNSNKIMIIERLKEKFVRQQRVLTPVEEHKLQLAESEYETMMKIFSNMGREVISDCITENMHNNLIKNTFGDVVDIDGEEVARETILTEKGEQCLKERLDYIFWLNKGQVEQDDLEEPEQESNLVIDISKTMIEPLFVDKDLESGEYDYPFTQFSDHYGISTEILLR